MRWGDDWGSGAKLICSTTQAQVPPKDIGSSFLGASHITNDGEHNTPSTSAHESGIVAAESRPGTGGPLSFRCDLYRRLRQGLATAAELLPADILSRTLQGPPTAPCRGNEFSVAGSGFSASFIDPVIAAPVFPPEGVSAESGASGEAVVSDTCAPPGILHEFIKHVRPFSVCFETPGSRDAMEQAHPATASVDDGETAPGVGLQEEDKSCRQGEGSASSSNRGATDVVDRNNMGAAFMSAGTNALGEVSDGRKESHRRVPDKTPSRLTCSGSAEVVLDRGSGDGEQEDRGSAGIAGAPRKPVMPAESSEALRRAKARLQGKRKLAYSVPAANDTSEGSEPAKSVAPRTTTCENGTSKAARGAHRKTKETRDRGKPRKSRHDSLVGWSSLSLKASKQLRTRMEAAAARDVSMPTSIRWLMQPENIRTYVARHGGGGVIVEAQSVNKSKRLTTLCSLPSYAYGYHRDNVPQNLRARKVDEVGAKTGPTRSPCPTRWKECQVSSALSAWSTQTLTLRCHRSRARKTTWCL